MNSKQERSDDNGGGERVEIREMIKIRNKIRIEK